MADRPYDNHGQYVPMQCAICGAGTLRYQGTDPVNVRGLWVCDGLLDPEDADKELQPCPNVHYDGEPRMDLEALRSHARGVDSSRGETFCGQTPMVGKDEHA